MAIEDFEWEGELPAPRAVRADGWFSRLRASVWLEPALKLGGSVLLLGVLAAIGVVATTYAKPGLELPKGSQPFVAALGTSWLKPTPSASAPASATRAVASATPQSESAGADTQPAGEAPPSKAAPSGITPEGKVVLNLASADELTKLPGIGMKRAQAIVALRTKLKRFKNPTDLLRVKGIGPRGLQRMLPHLVLDAP